MPFAVVTQVLGIAGIILVLIWCISFRGGLAWEATNKSLIFNVCTSHQHFPLSLSLSFIPVYFLEFWDKLDLDFPSAT